MDKKLPYPTRPVQFANGEIIEEYIIPEDDKEYVLEELYPFDPIPDLDIVMIDIHAEKEFIVRQFRVFWEHRCNWLVSPYYPESGGSVIDWMDLDAAVVDPGFDFVRRDELLGIDSSIWEESPEDIERFKAVSLDVLETLLEEGYLDPQSAQNVSPTVEQFLAFIRKHPKAKAHGYAVSPYREDFRISLEGLFVDHEDITAEMRRDFEELCGNADDYEDGCHLYSWWD